MQLHAVGEGEAVALVFGVIGLALYGIEAAVGVGSGRLDFGFFVGAVTHIRPFLTLLRSHMRPLLYQSLPDTHLCVVSALKLAVFVKCVTRRTACGIGFGFGARCP